MALGTYRYLLMAVALSALFPSAHPFINLFLNRHETFRLLGLTAELFYIREGKVNDYALKFVVPVPPSISELHFTWQSLITTPMPYSIALSVNDISALGTPTINITRRGNVPLKEQVFRIVLPCTGKVNAEVDVNVYINITMSASSNVTALTLRRKKICLKEIATTASSVENGDDGDGPIASTDSSSEEDEEGEETVLADPSAIIASSNPLYIAVGCASGFIFLLGILVTVCYVRSHKGRNSDLGNYAGVTSHLSVNKAGQSFLRVDALGNNLSNSRHNVNNRPPASAPRSERDSDLGSHCSSFRRLAAASYASLPRITPAHVYSEPICSPRLSDQVSEISVPRSAITLRDKLQEGTFGQIYSGVMRREEGDYDEEVMVKVTTNQASKMQASLFIQEGTSMYGMNHLHILHVIAACVEDPERPILVYPMSNPGNLKLFLQKCKFSPEGQLHTLLTQDLVSIAIQIAQGMIYLHRNQKIHKDLATRNCVVMSMEDGSLLVKITDMALSRDLFPTDYHCLGDNENRPVKWLALESLLHKDFSQWSDVWSYGVLVWELMTLGDQPYREVDPFEIDAYLQDGYRLFQPVNCPDKLYDVMVCCWNATPEERPTFPQLLTCLQDFYTALGRYI